MDGLQLSKIIREHMPWVKIIILSGHDEFNYAQAAVKIGVTEYLLKPINSQELIKALKKITDLLDQEIKDRESYKQLQLQAEGNLALLREKFLLRLVMGGVSSAEAVEQSQNLGLPIIAQYYLVLLVKVELCDKNNQFDYREYQRIDLVISKLVGNNSNILYTKKDLDELVLILKGDDPGQLQQDVAFWVDLVRKEGESTEICNLVIKMGSPQRRLSDIHHSFSEAFIGINTDDKNLNSIKPILSAEQSELLKQGRSALENYLKFGNLQDYDDFFPTFIKPADESVLRSDLVRNYMLVDIAFTITQFISDLGGKPDQLPQEINDIEKLIDRSATTDQVNDILRNLITTAILFRNSQVNHEQSSLIQGAKAHIDNSFSNPDLKMNEIAAKFNLSPGYFSTIFHQEIGESFRNYLNNLRISHAKKLLRTTNLKVSEIAYKSGYNDPHYFSTIFKKSVGFTPQQFRTQPKNGKN